MPVEPNPILDGTYGQVQANWRFELLDQTLTRTGDLSPLAAGSIDVNTSGAVKRTMSGFRLSQHDLNDVNPYTDRVAAWYQLGDGSQWPAGVFCFSGLPRNVSSGVSTLDATLMDQGFLIGQDSEQTFSVPARGLIIDVINRILDVSGIPPDRRDMPANSDVRTLDPIGWPSGTLKSKIIDELCLLGGWLPHYFDNTGTFVLRGAPNIDFDAPAVAYAIDDSRILAGTVIENDNLLDAPNVYRVVGNGTASGEISGQARVNPDLPYSVEKRGFEIVQTEKMQGIASSEQAQRMASDLAAASPGFQTVEFDSFADPRHDLFMLVAYNNIVYREVGFGVTLKSGGPMKHSLTLGGFPVAG